MMEQWLIKNDILMLTLTCTLLHSKMIVLTGRLMLTQNGNNNDSRC